MGLTGIQIFKLLPKTNCTECGVPTCLAFAMNLASGKAELSACPYVSEEAKEQLAEASAPPIRPVKIGSGDTQVTAGGETVMFRHEKTFYNKPGFAALITTDMDDATIETKLANYLAYQYERVGLNLRPELVAIKDVNGDAGRFESVIKLVQEKSDFSYILMSEDPGVLKAGVKISAGFKPLIYAATKETADELAGISKEFGCPVAIKAESLEQLREISEKMTAAGVKDLVLDSGSREVQKAFQDQIALRRAALIGKDRALGFPTICFPCEMADNLDMETVIASMFVAKYGGLIVMSDFQGESIFPLLVERLNIFTDPQRPMTVTQGIYEINGPNENSPVCVTSNFSLTYFIVSGEIESSRVPTWLLIMDTEGLSVMTAWAAGKFVGDAVASFVKKSGISDKINHKNIIIPGYAASISGDMEEELPGWRVWIGPREAAHIPKYLKEWRVE
jgi:acetyl-CoA decarbonylase/synthase complex subunit gamma